MADNDDIDVKQATEGEKPLTFSEKWTAALNKIREPIQKGLLWISTLSAANPWTTIISVVVLTLALVVIGIFTNITFESDDDVLFTPFGAYPTAHEDWIIEDSDFPPLPRDYFVLLHRNGGNMFDEQVSLQSIQNSFDVMEELEKTDGFDEVCPSTNNPDDDFETSCPWSGVTRFFNNSRQIFESQIQTHDELMEALSASIYPDGTFVLRAEIFGKVVVNEETNMLESAESYLMTLGLPKDDDMLSKTEEYEEKSVENIFDMAEANWDGTIVVEQFNQRSFAYEFGRGFTQNIPLLIAAFTIMIVFTIGVFSRKNWVLSRASLGAAAVCNATLGLMAGFGLMFICGIPITSIHGMLPFILVGIGLDDAFIISGEFYRTNPKKSVMERLQDTIEEVGLSITTTTVTTGVAFGLGCISSIPAVYWLCLYAIPCVFLDFIFSITFFVAVIAIDERRVIEQRRDCLCCLLAPGGVQTDDAQTDSPDLSTDNVQQEDEGDNKEGQDESFVDRIMKVYANFLLKPWVQAIVLVSFTALLAGCAYSASQLEQQFTIEFVIPEGSYVGGFLDAIETHNSDSGMKPDVTFRFVDQSLQETQQQMEDFIGDLVALDEISSPPSNFWLWDFRDFVGKNESGSANLGFNDQVALFLEDPLWKSVYANDIARNEKGEVTASRVQVFMDNVDTDVVKDQIDALKNQEDTARAQRMNRGIDGGDWPFFTFSDRYFIWEFFASCPEELTITIIMGVISVMIISVLGVPHFTAPLFVTPLICILFVDLLGVLQFSGVYVNSISYITLTIGIGLMVSELSF